MIVVESIDSALFERDDLRVALADHDISALHRALGDVGISQRRIAQRTGQSQSEVAEILDGRRVMAYDVLVRIAEGLSIPRERMGLSYGDAYPEGVMAAEAPEGVGEMLRRHVLAPPPLPSQLCDVHVAKVRDLARRLVQVARVHGPDLEMSSAATGWATRLLDVPGPEKVTKALMAAVADLHTIAGAGPSMPGSTATSCATTAMRWSWPHGMRTFLSRLVVLLRWRTVAGNRQWAAGRLVDYNSSP